jgi:hypothetical protein
MPLQRYAREHAAGGPGIAVGQFLDSLGFFSARRDTTARDTIRIHAGIRWLVDSLIVRSTFPFAVDSLQKVRFPRPYDAGEIQQLARGSVHFLAQRGFPFATTTVVIDTKCGADTSQCRAKVILAVQTEDRCVFDRALFTGEIHTRQDLLACDIAFHRGQLFDVRAIDESEECLLSRDYIAEARAGSVGVVPPGPDTVGKAAQRDSAGTTFQGIAVPFYIRDKSGLGLDGALAYQSQETSGGPLTGFLNLTLLNIFKFGESATLYYKGERGLQQFDLDLSKPHLFRLPLVGTAGFGLEIQEQNYGYLHGAAQVLVELRNLWQTGVAFLGHETIDNLSSPPQSWRYYGLDLVLQRKPPRYRVGLLAGDMSIRTGTGVADRSLGRFQRWQADVSAGGQVPVLATRQAVSGRLTAQTIIADALDTLHPVECFRTGGQSSIRGYAENEFPFRTVTYLQTEYLYYFSEAGSVYIFADGGVGFLDKISIQRTDRTNLFGYGLGIRVPVKIGSAEIAWARNYQETKGLGRIHVRIRNTISSGNKW